LLITENTFISTGFISVAKNNITLKLYEDRKRAFELP